MEFVQEPYSVRECANCGLLYRDRTLSAERFEAYYAAVDFSKWEIPGLFPTECYVLSILKKLPAGSRILDFGCSSGRLLERLCKDYRCFGFEVNAEAAAKASSKGLKVLDAAELTTSDLFDAVILLDVFEHLTAPLRSFRRCRRSLPQAAF